MISQEKLRMPRNEAPETGAVLQALLGPIVLITYVLGTWDLTASMGFTRAFPWSAGPLSNWLVWFALGLLLHLGSLHLSRQLHPGRSGRSG
jgi:hypothetical protein